MKKKIQFSLVYRDMWQSSGKFQPRKDQLERIAPVIIEMGCFSRVETNGGAFEQVNLLAGENPNDAVRAFCKPFNEVGIKTHMLDRGLNALRMYPVPDDVRALMYKVKAKQGTNITRIFDGLNDVRNIIPSIKWAKEGGMTPQCALCITNSPVHTLEYYMNIADQLIAAGAEEICLKDMAGIGQPAFLGKLTKMIKDKHPEIIIQYHGHSGPGLSMASILEVCNNGADIIDTAIDMAKELSMPLHVLHVGVGDGVEHLRRAKADGVDVTAETCTHYLTFTDRDARRCGAVMKTYPLIRTAADRQAVWQGLADGTLDWVCSDHAPHTCEEKHRSFWDAPAGISGIEGLSPVLLTAVHRGLLTLPRVAAITSANAARTFGLYPRKGVIRPGADADLAIVDMSAAYTFRQEKMYSKAKWSPYDGMSFQGRVVETILRGRTTMRDGQVLPDCFGQFLPVCTK